MRHLLHNDCALLVLPFVSIVQEKVTSMTAMAVNTRLKFVVEEYAAGKGTIPPTKRRERPCLFVATIEKGLGMNIDNRIISRFIVSIRISSFTVIA